MNLVTTERKFYRLTGLVIGVATLFGSVQSHGYPGLKSWGGFPKRYNTNLSVKHGESVMLSLRAGSQPASPPPSRKVKKTEALVAKGAALLEEKGAAAFAEMSVPGSKWFKGDKYLFVYDVKCNVLFNSASPEKVGKNTHGHPDKNGKKFHDALVAQASTPNKAGWVDYMWPKPGEDKPSQKWTYSKAVSIDGKSCVLMSGFYS